MVKAVTRLMVFVRHSVVFTPSPDAGEDDTQYIHGTQFTERLGGRKCVQVLRPPCHNTASLTREDSSRTPNPGSWAVSLVSPFLHIMLAAFILAEVSVGVERGFVRCLRQAVVMQVCLARLFATPWTVAHQAPLSLGFSRQESCRGLAFPPPGGLERGIELL